MEKQILINDIKDRLHDITSELEHWFDDSFYACIELLNQLHEELDEAAE